MLLGFVEDVRMPTTVLKVISERCDEKFVAHLVAESIIHRLEPVEI